MEKIFKGWGVVWDPEVNKAIARFDKNGELATSDESVIARLTDMGFKTDTPEAAPAKPAKKGKV